MEEVIFQGSSARRPVNIAEVSLHFENDDGALSVPFREVVITRRLSRSGESDYFLNRSSCRLRDIHDMVRGTGLGADSGVVIESKMIDALLSDRPDERRELFEEAAGIGLYRDRKRTAERRLEETSVDLSRIDDLISEVQTQVRSLARQRKRAERHAELAARRFTVEIALAAREMDAWRDELARLEGRVAELRTSVPAAEESVAATEAARDAAHGARAAAEARRNELARLVAEQTASTQQLRAEIAVAEERQRNALSRRERAEQERREGDFTAGKVSDDLERAVAHRTQLDGEMALAQSALTGHVAEEESVRAALASSRAAVETAGKSARKCASGRIGTLSTDRRRSASSRSWPRRRLTLRGADSAHRFWKVPLAGRCGSGRRTQHEPRAELDLQRRARCRARCAPCSARGRFGGAVSSAARGRRIHGARREGQRPRSA